MAAEAPSDQPAGGAHSEMSLTSCLLPPASFLMIPDRGDGRASAWIEQATGRTGRAEGLDDLSGYSKKQNQEKKTITPSSSPEAPKQGAEERANTDFRHGVGGR